MLIEGNKNGALYMVKVNVEMPTSNFVNQDSNSSLKPQNEKLILWHKRLAHLGIDNVKLMSKNHMADGLDDLKNSSSPLCQPCVLGKITKLPFNRKVVRATQPLQLVHTDVCGPITPVT